MAAIIYLILGVVITCLLIFILKIYHVLEIEKKRKIVEEKKNKDVIITIKKEFKPAIGLNDNNNVQVIIKDEESEEENIRNNFLKTINDCEEIIKSDKHDELKNIFLKRNDGLKKFIMIIHLEDEKRMELILSKWVVIAAKIGLGKDKEEIKKELEEINEEITDLITKIIEDNKNKGERNV